MLLITIFQEGRGIVIKAIPHNMSYFKIPKKVLNKLNKHCLGNLVGKDE